MEQDERHRFPAHRATKLVWIIVARARPLVSATHRAQLAASPHPLLGRTHLLRATEVQAQRAGDATPPPTSR